MTERARSAALGLVVATCAAACGGGEATRGVAAPRPASRGDEHRGANATSGGATADEAWPGATSSPHPATPHFGVEAALLDACGKGDAALDAVATDLAARRARGLPPLLSEDVAELLRAAGEPHVWPRTWVAIPEGDASRAARALGAWRARVPSLGEARCGVATHASNAGDVLAVVVVDALADLEPLPSRAHAGEWLTVSAKLLVPSERASVVLLGPHGAPRSVPASLEGGRLRARFAPDSEGPFTVQVVADVAGSPRPVLEARVFADVPPAKSLSRAPGEEAASGARDASEALFTMLDTARQSEGRPPLQRDKELDALALAHARRMQSAHTVGHDVGDGDPVARVTEAGYTASAVGENAAHAESTMLAHRALWASPSHRRNVLDARFDRVGVAAVTGDDGSVWATELFARVAPP